MHNRAAQSGNGCFAVCILLDATLFPPENVKLGKVDIFQRDVHRDRFVFGNFDAILDGSVAVFSYLKRVLAYGAFHCVCARRFVEGKIFDFCFAVGADYIDGYAVAACRRIASFGKADGSVKSSVLNYGSRHLDIVSANVAFAVFVFVLVRFYRSRIFDVVLFAILPVICVVETDFGKTVSVIVAVTSQQRTQAQRYTKHYKQPFLHFFHLSSPFFIFWIVKKKTIRRILLRR